ncbi:spermidine synthase [Corynebacterium auris]|uniref:spermidine synthase n=1 Tax=Corynebacterium auris TaxID=44750 RepID=UPI0025B2EDB8|nr:fused MFS/spermidine synthase [Corynebacterium auris]WJY67739.1 spermidine synthase [Corynebacterium auris]
MQQRKPRHPRKRIEGTYPTSTGTARIVADPARDGAYTLEVNDVPGSHVVLGAPEVLTFDYMQWIAGLIDAPPTTVHLGAAACCLPSYVHQRWGARTVAVEIDAELARLVRWAFEPDVEIVVAEARAFTHALAPGSVDVLVRDVFSGPATPRHLTTVEFYRAAHRALAPGGVYAANVGDRAGLPETRAELAGLREVFAHVGAISTADMLDGRAYGNIVLAASDRPLTYAGPALFRGAEWATQLGGTPRHDRKDPT